MWRAEELVGLVRRTLAERDRALRAEQAVYGLDALDEVGLHPILAGGFEASGLGVYRERLYPGEILRRAKATHRERCDLVLTADASAPLLDPVNELIASDSASGTLFEPIAESLAPQGPLTEVGEAYWLEVKSTAQFAYVAGVPQPNRKYSTELVAGPSRDVRKIAREAMINAGGVLVVLFSESEATARHDLHAMAHRMLDDDLPIGEPRIETVPIEDRAGHTVAAAALVPVRL